MSTVFNAPRRAEPSTLFRKRGRLLSQVAVAVFLIWVLLPLLVVLQNSFKTTNDIFSGTPSLLFRPTFSNYDHILGGRFESFLPSLANSAIVAVITTLLSLALATPSAYAFARLRIWRKSSLAQLILFSRMVPPIALVVPFYVVFATLHLLNTYWALVISYTTFNLPLGIWMMRSFFEDVPIELEEAARVDGASRLTAFLRVALPLAAPGIAATAVLTLLGSWNEFLFAVVLTGNDTKTMPVAVSNFIGTVSIDWGGSSAAAMLAMVPIFAMGLAVQRFFVRGLTMGAVKG